MTVNSGEAILVFKSFKLESHNSVRRAKHNLFLITRSDRKGALIARLRRAGDCTMLRKSNPLSNPILCQKFGNSKTEPCILGLCPMLGDTRRWQYASTRSFTSPCGCTVHKTNYSAVVLS